MELARELREISKETALKSYQELKAATADAPDFRRIGLPALDYWFLHHRLKTRTRRHISFYEAMKNPTTVRRLNKLVVQYKKKALSEYDRTQRLKAQYQVFQLYYGTVNQFRPLIAKWVYSQLKPRVGVLDFSMGWGGRLLAAMSMGIPYIGIDANTKLEASYRNMIEMYEPDANVKLHFQPSEQVKFNRFQYDLVFTSPPYFMIEEYEKMPHYKDKQDFLETFFIPVVKSAWDNLLTGGHMALNMPAEMYEAVRSLLPAIKAAWELPLSNRHPVNAAKQALLGSEDKERHELIYVWRKPRKIGQVTRKARK
jgi:hypothetical protein